MATPSHIRQLWLSKARTRPFFTASALSSNTCILCQHRVVPCRQFSASSARRKAQSKHERESFTSRLRAALKDTPIQWKPIPVGLGIGFLGLLQFYRINEREKRAQELEDTRSESGNGNGNGEKPKKRKRIRPTGPWTVQLMSTLPLKALSRLWGRFNELDIPYYLRVPGFRLYSWIFGVNLSEVGEPDLHAYPNLAKFFYRTLKPGVRPLDTDPSALLSPADGRVLQFGIIERNEVEQVKGVTYSLEALLGSSSPTLEGAPDEISTSNKQGKGDKEMPNKEEIKAEEEFANVNGISLVMSQSRKGAIYDASTKSKSSSIAEVRADFALKERKQGWSWFSTPEPKKDPTALYYVVIYLAPGDYHRFHSPTSWVVEKRRHFAGELYSVSPYLQRTLPGLFTLNERVVLLGRWRHGFFSYTPVGATNVGSIVVNFDKELRTNSLTTDTAADRAAEEAQERGEPYCGYAEAGYSQASTILGGHALRKGEEMGGFQLGSSIVLVFEAPTGQRKSLDEGWNASDLNKSGWRWAVEKGQKVKYGQAIGFVDEKSS